jgi:hypothetical protein
MSQCIAQYAHMHSSTLDARPIVDRRDREHELWLAMRSAYDDYQEASEALDAVASRGPISISCRDRVHGIESLAAKQRIVFEKYIEKRLEYSEFVRDRSDLDVPQLSGPNQRQDLRGSGLGGTTSRIAVGAALIGIAVFIVHEQGRIHRLDVARDEGSGAVNHSRDDHHSLSLQSQLASREAVRPTEASPRAHPKSVVQAQNRIAKDTRRSRHTEIATAAVRMYDEPIRPPKSEGRSYYWFTLTPSTKFKQVGPVGLSLRKDPKQGYFDLCLTVANSKVKKRVKLDAPIWINATDRLQSIAVVVTRIEKNYVRGYLSEPSQRRPVTTARDRRS